MRLTSSQIDAIKQTAAEVHGIKRRASLFNHFGVSYATVSWAVKPADKEGVRMSNVRPYTTWVQAGVARQGCAARFVEWRRRYFGLWH